MDADPLAQGVKFARRNTTVLEFYRVAFRKKVHRAIDELQDDLDSWITEDNKARSLVLRKNSDADLLGCNADDQGENDRRLTRSDTMTRSLNQAPSVSSSLSFSTYSGFSLKCVRARDQPFRCRIAS